MSTNQVIKNITIFGSIVNIIETEYKLLVDLSYALCAANQLSTLALWICDAMFSEQLAIFQLKLHYF